jgi:DNA-binding LacI/PurR family transcriptional regulator
MQEIGYVPRRDRRRNGNGNGNAEPHRVGLLFPDTSLQGTQTPLAIGLAQGVEQVLSEQNIYLTVLTLCPDGSLPKCITNGELDGLIVRAGVPSQASEERLMLDIQAAALPTVWTFEGPVPSEANTVMVDNCGCGEWAANRVLEIGCRNVFLVRHIGGRNLALEIRNTAFGFHMARHGLTSRVLTPATPEELVGIIEGIEQSEVTIFVGGHDLDVQIVHRALANRNKNGSGTSHLVAVMTDQTALPPHLGEDVHVVHIDPQQIGMAAARQLLARRECPWAPPARMLVLAKELQGRIKDDSNHINSSRMASRAEALVSQ